MKVNMPVTQREVTLTESQSIISMTDLKGQISYVNKDFIEVSGFSEAELIGQNHNIVRHPDMPPAAYKHLWDTLKAGQPWRGTVKNRCKNGDHYWVDAFVTPVVQQGVVTGYQSVRVKPSSEQIQQAEKLYQRVNQQQLQELPKRFELRLRTSVEFRLLTTLWLALLTVTLWLGNVNGTGLVLCVGGAAVILLASWWWSSQRLIKPLRQLAKAAKAIANGDLLEPVVTDRSGALGETQLALKMTQGRLRAMMGRIHESAQALTEATKSFSSLSKQTDCSMQSQMSETDQVATAMEEMAATVQEVANNCNLAADAATQADQSVDSGGQVVNQTQNSIRELADEINQAETVIQGLYEDTNNIGSILDVIRGVAEQTNLLALNAAIEAARAGEQGRGFAVVADEVRSLAQRTQNSTEEIQQMIESLQHKSDAAVDVMRRGRGAADKSVAQAAQAAEALQTIGVAVAQIRDMSTQIATAAEQQSLVSSEMHGNIVRVRSLASDTADSTSRGVAAAADLSETTQRLVALAGDYRG